MLYKVIHGTPYEPTMPGESNLKREAMSLDDFEELLSDMPPDGRWELIGGRVIKGMVGARWEHHRIIRNLDFALQSHFRRTGRPCSTFTESFYLKDRSIELTALPDLMVQCGTLPPGATELSDPIVAVEILSPGSEARDRLEKWPQYRLLPSLQHYVLIARDKFSVESYDRSDGGWRISGPLGKAEDVLRLDALEFSVPLADIYEGVIT